ncbi:MAG: hypothetical protein VX834_07540, partial [Myxococcota bacterium]|nr:hypothetical protein [Myxococcota bacterium]
GLSSLTRVGRGIAVSDHESLRDIARLKSLQSVTGDIAFISNPVLPACSVDIFEYDLKKAQVSGNVVQRFNDDRAGCGRSSLPER